MAYLELCLGLPAAWYSSAPLARSQPHPSAGPGAWPRADDLVEVWGPRGVTAMLWFGQPLDDDAHGGGRKDLTTLVTVTSLSASSGEEGGDEAFGSF